MSHNILIIGGGFAGFWAAVAARRVAGPRRRTLVSPEPVLEIRPRLYEAKPETLAVECCRICTLEIASSAAGDRPRRRGQNRDARRRRPPRL